MTDEHTIRNHVAALKQAMATENERAIIDHGFALLAQACVDLNRLASAAEHLAKKG